MQQFSHSSFLSFPSIHHIRVYFFLKFFIYCVKFITSLFFKPVKLPQAVEAGEKFVAGCKGGVDKQEYKDAIKGYRDIGEPIINIYLGDKDKQQKDQENKEDLAKCVKDNTIFGDGGIWGMAGYKMRERVCPLLVKRDENYEERKRELEGVGVALAKVVEKEVPGFRDVLGAILKGSSFKEENYDNVLSYMGGLLGDNVTWGGMSSKIPAAWQVLLGLSNPFNVEEKVLESERLNSIGEWIGGTNSTTGRNGFRVGVGSYGYQFCRRCGVYRDTILASVRGIC